MRPIAIAAVAVGVCAVLGACSGDGGSVAETTVPATTGTPDSAATTSTSPSPARASIAVTSMSWKDGERIPAKYSCVGDNVSPPLDWSGVPAGVASLALVVDDPDAPRGTFVHWVVVNLSVDIDHLRENTSAGQQLANSAGNRSWTGPCPPPGPAHHYRFTVYALPTTISERETTAALETIRATAVARGTLVGTFQR